MITGTVLGSRKAMVRLSLRGDRGQDLPLDAVVDTGFTDFITLPASVLSGLAPQYAGTRRARLADGAEVVLDTYLVDILWDGQTRTVEAIETNGVPLAGMALLYGCRLIVDVRVGGNVTIEALP